MEKITKVLLWPITTMFVIALKACEWAHKRSLLLGCLVLLLAIPFCLPMGIVGICGAAILTPLRLRHRRRAFSRCTELQHQRLTDFVAMVQCVVTDSKALLMEECVCEEDLEILKRRAERCVEIGITPRELRSFVPLQWRSFQEYLAQLKA